MPIPVTYSDLTYESLSSDVSPVPSTSQRSDVMDLTYEEDSDPRIKYPGIKYTASTGSAPESMSPCLEDRGVGIMAVSEMLVGDGLIGSLTTGGVW